MGQVSFQFSAQEGLTSDLIEWMGKGLYSHVDIILSDGRLLGARLDGGVQIRLPGYAPFKRVLRVDIPCTDEQETKFYEFAISQIGKPYDKEGIAGIIFGRDWRDDSAWFCSEYGAACCEKSKIFPYQLAAPDYKIDPNVFLVALSTKVQITIPKEEK